MRIQNGRTLRPAIPHRIEVKKWPNNMRKLYRIQRIPNRINVDIGSLSIYIRRPFLRKP